MRSPARAVTDCYVERLDGKENRRAAFLPGTMKRDAISRFGLRGYRRVAQEPGKDRDGFRRRVALNVCSLIGMRE